MMRAIMVAKTEPLIVNTNPRSVTTAAMSVMKMLSTVVTVANCAPVTSWSVLC